MNVECLKNTFSIIIYLLHKHMLDKFKVTKLLCNMFSFYDGCKVCYRKQLTLPHTSFTWRIIFHLFTPSCVPVLWRVDKSILRWEKSNLFNKGENFGKLYWNTFVVFSSIYLRPQFQNQDRNSRFNFYLFVVSEISETGQKCCRIVSNGDGQVRNIVHLAWRPRTIPNKS